MSILNSARSLRAAMQASAAVGRCAGLRHTGRLQALTEARRGLDLLGQPYIRRSNPPEASALASLTVMAEELAAKLDEPGASKRDLVDTIEALRAIDTTPSPDLCLSLPFLEERLGARHEG